MMRMKLIYPRWPKLGQQTEFHLPPHAPVNFAAAVPCDVELTFADENRQALDTSDRPDVVALSVMLTSQVPRAKAIAADYRASGVKVIAGGIAVMLHPEDMSAACDSIFLGEVEGRLELVLDDLRGGELERIYEFTDDLPPIESIGTARRDILDDSDFIRRRIRRYHEFGIGVEGVITLGTDEQDRNAILRLIDFTLEVGLDMAEFTVLTPFAETPYRRHLEREGRVLHDDWSKYTADQVVFQPKRVTPTELQDLYHLAWEKFYGPGGRELKMACLFRKVVQREMADGIYRGAPSMARTG
jgi:radical SAM superfamily enzyme YgiQ (UPF0313 family)